VVRGTGLAEADEGARRKLLTRIMGGLLLLLAVFMVPSALIAALQGEQDLGAFLVTIAGLAVVGGALWRLGRGVADDVGRREGLLIVAMCWLVAVFAGALPFYLYAHHATLGFDDRAQVASYPTPHGAAVHGRCDLPGAGRAGSEFCSFSSSLFESASGFTTTGATVLERGLWAQPERLRPEELPHGLLFWRNMTQWLGGMGIIVLAVALLPLLGIGGMQLFRAEVPGPTAARLVPRIGETARQLWLVYGILTAALVVMLSLGGIGAFMSVTHAFGTLASGGFSPLAASVGGLHSTYAEWVIVAFMLATGVNYSLHHRALVLGKPSYLSDPELRFWLVLLAVTSAVVVAALWSSGVLQGGEAVRHGLFTVVSLATTTGFASVDYSAWVPGLPVLVLLITFIGALGGCTGSTSGGVKVIRLAIGLRVADREFYRMIHPRGVRPVRFGHQRVDFTVIDGITSFLVIFFVTVVIGGLWLAAEGFAPLEAMTGSLACVANVGPAFGAFGPTGNYNEVSDLGKVMLSSLMVLGRLELLSVILLFSRGFWR
jgi:trk system potassium uptake protein TrkH